MKFKYFMLLSSLILTSCTVGPNYHKPAAAVPHKYKEYKPNKDWKIATPQDLSDRGEWWRRFDDGILDELEDRLNANNQNVINAYYNYQQACALVAEAGASYFPTLSAGLSLTRQKNSVSSTNNFNNNINVTNPTGSTTTNTTFSRVGSSGGKINWTHQTTLNAAWELDIWGAVRRSVEAAAAGAQASAALLAATRLSMQASLAQYYFQMRGYDEDQRLLNETVASYKKTLQLTKNEYSAGTVSRADVIQAQSQLEAAQAQAINVKILRAQYEHAIAMLIGVPPDALTIEPTRYDAVPPKLPIIVPTAVLERRPDIAQAERNMAQANAQVGVAISAFFPTFDLTGTASIVGTGLGPWFSLSNLAWAYGGQISQLIFDGGLRQAQVAAAKANYHAVVATYRQTVLTAFQEVEDNLVAVRVLRQQILVQRKAAESARKALSIVTNQYRAGIVPYINVMIQQVQALNAEKAAIDVNYQQMVAAVNLIKALGGGWDGLICA